MSGEEMPLERSQAVADALAAAGAALAANYTRLSAEIATLPIAERNRCFLMAGTIHGKALIEGRTGLLALELAAATVIYNRHEGIK